MNRTYVPYPDRAEHNHFQGAWGAGVTYSIGQEVENDGGLFECILGHVATVALEPIPDVDARIIATSLQANEIPAGTKNGSNPTFTLAHTPIGEIQLTYQGMVLAPGAGNDYTLSGSTITMLTYFPNTGENFLAFYAY